MDLDTAQLPDDVTELKSLFIATQHNYESRIKLLEDQVNLLRHKLFGAKSEKLPVGDGQLFLCDEAEVHRVDEAPEEEIVVPAHTKRRGHRKQLPDDLPRIEQVHDLPDEEKQCPCGAEKTRIGEETAEQLDYVPATVQVIKHIRLKYACKRCEGTAADEPAVSISPLPEQLLPKSIATPGLLAQIITAKYADALPLYRQEKIFERLGIELKRQTMAAWIIKVAAKCAVMVDLMCAEIRSGPCVQIDETPVQVLEEPGRKATTKSYMWVFRGGDPDKPVLLYQYHPTRSGDVAKAFLGDYGGYVQTDGYPGYEFADDLEDVKHLGCWAHVRRKFIDAVKARGKNSKKKKKGLADAALDFTTRLYAIEHSARDRNLEPDQVHALRQKKTAPLLVDFREWLDEAVLKTPPRGLLGTAISYTLSQWDRLETFLDDGRLLPDNNLAENAIRPFVVGRKNWLCVSRRRTHDENVKVAA
jgi:transposase